jgi:glucose/arabinose dehydrogenase
MRFPFRLSAFSVSLLLSVAMVSCPPPKPVDGATLDDINLPAGFSMAYFAENVEGARSLALSPNGIVFVGTRGDKVYAVVDNNKDAKAETVVVVDSGLNQPNGVAVYNGDLYVAEISRVIKYANIEATYSNNPTYTVVNDTFPTDTHHGWKFIAFGPDNKLYVPVGAPCNVCLRDDDERYASIMRMDPDGSNLEVFSEGIRNTVGFDWHPSTNELWFTENGRDMMGDNVPPDELNRAPSAGLHFGFPYWHGSDVPDPTHGAGHNAGEYTLPVQELGPHVAALGMRFYTGLMFPAQYQNQIFIAEHGSWNRSTPIGYRVMLVKLNGNAATSYEVFAEGWLKNGTAWGRPVDVQQMPDGSLLVSDDRADAVYRITYNSK